MKKPILILGLSLFLSACNNLVLEADRIVKSAKEQAAAADTKEEKPLQGTIKHANDGRGTVSEITYKDGKKTGMAKEYYPGGQLWKESEYKDGRLHGVAKVYDRQGRLERSVTYQNGKKHGPYKRYFNSGKPKLEIEYNQNLPMPGYVAKDYTGEPKDDPRVTVAHIDQLATQGVYSLEVGLSKPHKNTVVYVFEDPKLWNPSTPFYEHKLPLRNGKAVFPIQLEKGYYFAGEMHFFVEYELDRGLKVVKHKKVNLTVENDS